MGDEEEGGVNLSPFLGVVELLFVLLRAEGEVVVNVGRLCGGDGEDEGLGVDAINVFVDAEIAFRCDSFLGVDGDEV